MKREYGVEVEVGAPKVSYREAPTQKAEYNFKHKKQTGGSGQYAHIVGWIEPLRKTAKRKTLILQRDQPRENSEGIHPLGGKGFRDSIHKGPVAGFPIVGVKTVLNDGSYHDVDSSDMAFRFVRGAVSVKHS